MSNKIVTKEFRLIFFLIVLFLAIRIPILFTFEGVLGGDEVYEINRDIRDVLDGDYFYFLRDKNNAYVYFIYLLQIPFTLPFYLLFPTNEFSSFLGTTIISIIILIAFFLYLQKHFSRRIAIIASLIFIISPIGFTISTLVDDTKGMNLVLLSFIPFFLMFFSRKKKIQYWSMVLLALLPLIHPYHVILWPSCMVYLILKNYFESKKITVAWKKLQPYIIFFMVTTIILLPFYFVSLKSMTVQDKIFYLNYPDPSPPLPLSHLIIERNSVYLDYFKRLFILPNYSNIIENSSIRKNIKFISYISFSIYLLILTSSIIYFIFEAIKNKKIKPIFFFAIYPLFFVLTELLFTNRFMLLVNRDIATSSHFLKILFFMSIVLVSSFASYKRRLSFIVYSFIIMNLIINVSMITSPAKNNNFINYNLGNEDNIIVKNDAYEVLDSLVFYNISLTKDELLVLTNKSNNMLIIISNGFYARDSFSITEENYDYKLFGFGLKLFYGNELGINFCNIILDKNKIILCREGYVMQEQDFKNHLHEIANGVV